MSSCSVSRARLPGRRGSEYAHYLVIRERTLNGARQTGQTLHLVSQIQIKLVKIGDRFEHSPSKASFPAIFSTCSEKMVVSVLRSMVEKLL